MEHEKSVRKEAMTWVLKVYAPAWEDTHREPSVRRFNSLEEAKRAILSVPVNARLALDVVKRGKE